MTENKTAEPYNLHHIFIRQYEPNISNRGLLLLDLQTRHFYT